MSRKLLLLQCFVFVTATLFSQNINSVVRKIAKHNVYESAVTGFAASPSIQYKRFETLTAKASKEKLVSLATSHKNAVVRLYAYQALVFKNESIPQELKEKFASDNTSVKTLSGCMARQRKVNDLLPRQF